MKYVDIVLVKQQVDNDKLKTKIDMFGNILLEDTLAGEAVKIGKLPETYSFHKKGKWEPVIIDGRHSYCCTNCGRHEYVKYNWCTCGADMRETNKPSKELKELLDTL